MITITPTYSLNTTKFPPNKEGKVDRNKIPIASNLVFKTYDPGIVVLKPVIDRLIFTFSPDAALEEIGISPQKIKEHIIGSLTHEALLKKADPGANVNVTFVGADFTKKKIAPKHDLSVFFTPTGHDEGILVQFAPAKAEAPFMRVDLTPSKYSPSQIKEFRLFLSELFLAPEGQITAQSLLERSEIQRIDIAVDILGAKPTDLEIKLATKLDVTGMTYQSKSGRAETIYLKKKATGNADGVYDKRRERLAKGFIAPYGDILHSRFEARIMKTTFGKLQKAHNRCKRVMIRALDKDRFVKLEMGQRLFTKFALDRNVETALKYVEPEFRDSFKAEYENSMMQIWDAEGLWKAWLNNCSSLANGMP